MKSLITTLFFAFALSTVTGCSGPRAYQSKLDPLALQQMQTQEFETSKKILFASVVSVFQDTGFTVETGDLESGIVTAKSPTTTELGFGAYYTVGVRATAFVEETRPNYAKVRLNYIEGRSKDRGYGSGATDDIPNEDAKYYEKIFNKIQEAVFLREANKKADPVKSK